MMGPGGMRLPGSRGDLSEFPAVVAEAAFRVDPVLPQAIISGLVSTSMRSLWNREANTIAATRLLVCRPHSASWRMNCDVNTASVTTRPQVSPVNAVTSRCASINRV